MVNNSFYLPIRLACILGQTYAHGHPYDGSVPYTATEHRPDSVNRGKQMRICAPSAM